MLKRYIGKNFKNSIHILLIVIVSIIVYKFMDNLDSAYDSVSQKIAAIISVSKPFFLAIIFAYILNPIVNGVEHNFQRLFNQKLKRKTNRLLSTLVVYIVLVAVITLSMKYMLPRIIVSITDLIGNIPTFVQENQGRILQWTNKLYSSEMYHIGELLEQNINNIFDTSANLLQKSLNNFLEKAIELTTKIFVIILALIVSFYILMDKAALLREAERFFRAILEDKTVDKIKQFVDDANTIFVKFVLGKSLDSLIIGILCFIGLTILKSPYSVLISVIVGITNMIPYFGPFIGEVIGFIFVAFVNPIKAVWVLLYILILQQFDSFILTPKILGDKMGVNPLWIIFSIVLGGRLFGIIGMFLGAPTIAVVIFAIRRYVDKRLKEKEQEQTENNALE